MKITKRQLKRIIKHTLLESSRAGEAFDEGYSDATQERGLNPRRQGDVDYMQGFEMGEEDVQYDVERAGVEDDDPGFVLPRPKEDPMGRGSKTSALRRSVMRR